MIETFNTVLDHCAIAASERDILLQLYIERKISRLQLRAGRLWQRDMEDGAIQPCSTIDWSGPHQDYQRAGDITDEQAKSMRQRRAFSAAHSDALARFLDICLDADRGRSDIKRLLPYPVSSIEATIEAALEALCVHYGLASEGPVTHAGPEDSFVSEGQGRVGSKD